MTTRSTELEIGHRMPDGTLYAGISPDTGRKMYAMPVDAKLTYTFNEAQRYAQSANSRQAHGYQDWLVPTENELHTLFKHRAAIGGFNVDDAHPHVWYWSSSSDRKWLASGQRFSDGFQNYAFKIGHSSVRLIRQDKSECV